MAKYIGTYSNSGDVQTALTNQELSRPFVAYTTDNDQVIYGSAAVGGARVGDIVVYATSDQLLHYIPQTKYNTTAYPTAEYVPVGVVAYPQADNVFSGATGEVTFMGLNWLAKNSPDSGMTTEQNIEWGDSSVDITGLTNYSNIASASTDMNGKANTAAVLAYATGQTDWRTASAITFTNGQNMYPLFECAWRYHTSGTVQGDWYVPACGQLYYLQQNADELAALNAGFALVGSGTFEFTNKYRGTSTENSSSHAWYWDRSDWNGNSKHNVYGWKARPFAEALIYAL